jgi:hypothetical protein
LTHYQSELSPETEIVYSEISVWVTADGRRSVQEIKAKSGTIRFGVSVGQITLPPTTIAGQGDRKKNLFEKLLTDDIFG